MNVLLDLIERSEDRLMHRILAYAKEHGYTPFTSTLLEAWRASIVGLSESLAETIRTSNRVIELDAGADFAEDPSASFGVMEARRHRERGITLGMFLGLFKYYRQAYVDLIRENDLDPEKAVEYRYVLERFFDRVELGFCSEWASGSQADHVAELQTKNRLLTNEKNKYLTIFESVDDPVLFLNADYDIENMNLAGLETFTDSDVSGAMYYGSASCETLQRSLMEDRGDMESRNSYERVLETRKGPRLFVVKPCRMRDVSDKFSGFVLILRDITDARTAEERLRQFFRAVEQSPAMILLTDTDRNIEYVNPRFTDLTGYRADEAIGRTPRLLKPDSASESTYGEMWRSVANGTEWSGIVLDQRKDGTLFWTSTQLSAVTDDGGTITKYLMIAEDISERRAREIRKAHAEKMQSLGEIASGIAHEINNMLFPIFILAEKAANTLSESDPRFKHLKMVVGSAERIKELVSRILTFGRSEGAKTVRMDLRDVVASTEALLRATVPSHIEIRDSLGESPIMVEGYTQDIQTVILNLVGNAVDAIARDIGSITIAVDRVEGDAPEIRGLPDLNSSAYARLSVTDTGCGMDEETLEKACQPFFTTKEVGSGTGLGLSTVQGIAREYGGTLTVESRPGQGATFRVFLPLAPPSS